MTRAFVGVGSNIDPGQNVERALRLLAVQASIVKISTVYRTEPELLLNQPWYYNCVAEIATELCSEELKFAVLRGIEKKLGRKRTQDRYASRPIDLDLLWYGDSSLETTGVVSPDPEIFKRPYLAAALMELSPNLEPLLAAVAAEGASQKMQPLEDYTRSLREGILHACKH